MSSNVAIVRCVVAELNPEKRLVVKVTPRASSKIPKDETDVIELKISDKSSLTVASFCQRWNASRTACWWFVEFSGWHGILQVLSLRSSKYSRSGNLCYRSSRRNCRFK